MTTRSLTQWQSFLSMHSARSSARPHIAPSFKTPLTPSRPPKTQRETTQRTPNPTPHHLRPAIPNTRTRCADSARPLSHPATPLATTDIALLTRVHRRGGFFALRNRGSASPIGGIASTLSRCHAPRLAPLAPRKICDPMFHFPPIRWAPAATPRATPSLIPSIQSFQTNPFQPFTTFPPNMTTPQRPLSPHDTTRQPRPTDHRSTTIQAAPAPSTTLVPPHDRSTSRHDQTTA